MSLSPLFKEYQILMSLDINNQEVLDIINEDILLVTKKNSVAEDLLLLVLTIAIEPLSKVFTKFSVSEGFLI